MKNQEIKHIGNAKKAFSLGAAAHECNNYINSSILEQCCTQLEQKFPHKIDALKFLRLSSEILNKTSCSELKHSTAAVYIDDTPFPTS